MAVRQRDTLLIQFAREPVPGEVKTRMLPHLSPDEAASLHCDLVEWTARRLVASKLGPVQLWVSGAPMHSLFDLCRSLGVEDVCAQVGDDLGARMLQALNVGFEDYAKVVLVGSDCPELDADYLGEAVRALDSVPVVLGEANDGGYVLIAATQIHANVFRNIPWGSETVFRKTIEALRNEGLDFTTLPALSDIDRPEDLAIWERIKG